MAELNELEKRLDWLDSERQKDKKTIIELKDSLTGLRDELQSQNVKLKTHETDLKFIRSIPGRLDQTDQKFTDIKSELLKTISDLEKTFATTAKKTEKQHKDEIDQLNKKISEYQAEQKSLNDLKKTVQSRVEEEFRLSQKVDEVSKAMLEVRTSDAEIQRQQKLLLDELHLEGKRISDLQIENSTLRKRVEEIRNANDVEKESVRKMDKRIDDLSASEKERKQNQVAFMEKISLSQLEKENLWKEWQEKYSELVLLNPVLNSQLLALEETHRSVKKTQVEFDDVIERFNRRINEITEINRLAEERFRQEWVSFKADDQKRWTNYSLSREEEVRDDSRQLTRIADRLVQLEDVSQELKDAMNLINEETRKLLGGVYNLSQELMESYNQAFRKRN
jgi:chromosome segregation ATPase